MTEFFYIDPGVGHTEKGKQLAVNRPLIPSGRGSLVITTPTTFLSNGLIVMCRYSIGLLHNRIHHTARCPPLKFLQLQLMLLLFWLCVVRDRIYNGNSYIRPKLKSLWGQKLADCCPREKSKETDSLR
jgi:hypothetical protein